MALPTYMKSFYDNGQIVDLKPLIDADSEWKDRYQDGALGDFEYGDVILGAPRIAIYNSLILWNKEIFAKCGYNEFPKTAEEFKECVAKTQGERIHPDGLRQQGAVRHLVSEHAGYPVQVPAARIGMTRSETTGKRPLPTKRRFPRSSTWTS